MPRPLDVVSRYLRQGTGSAARTPPLHVAFAAALAVAVYANALGNGLHVDDRYQIVTNPWIQSLRNLPTIFSSGVWDFDGRVSSYYRPMMYVLYSLVYAVAGAAPWAYHLLNVALHAGSTILALLIARALLEGRAGRNPWWHAPALLAGLLFAVHPIHTEPVAWAAGVVDLSYSFFYLLAFYLLVRGAGRTRNLVLALAAYGAALLSKEPAITFPAVALVYWSLSEGRQLGIRGLARRLAPWIVVSAAYLALRSVALGGLAPSTSPVGLSPSEYVLTSTALLGRFLRAQVFPATLNFWHVFTPVTSPWSVEAMAALATVGTWVVLFAWAIARRAVVPAVALAFAVLPLMPALMLASLNQGLENAFAERYLYLPSYGVVLLAGWMVAALYPRRVRAARALTAVLAAVSVVGAAVTVNRNPVWKSSLSLWADASAKSPQSGVANLNYGYALMAAGRSAEGRRYADRGVALNRDIIRIEMERAISYARQQRSSEAILAFHRVLAMDPGSSQAHYNLGVLYEERGQTAMAIGEYLAAIKLNPAAADAHNNLGILYFTGGFRQQALQHLEEAVRLRPQDAAFRANLDRAKSR
jgi:tetratricopeptide (TPR) repeat protein